MKTPIFSARLSLFLLTRRRRQGFSMLEVLVALFAAFFFLMGTMNAMVVAAVMQVKAERQAQGLYLIQQDLEAIRARAADPSLGATTMCTASTFSAGYGGALKTVVDAISKPTPQGLLSLPNKVYTLTRTTGGSDTNPSILTLSYTVSHPNDSEPIATLYTEVLPNVALSC
ncbi:MAG: type II secretion system protein [Cyanobacteria bacterium RI_101]|nr:type II secretion system protein [Cyanobacteria bacterium RI_101]